MPAPMEIQCEHCEARAPTPLKTPCTKCKAAVYCSAAHLAEDAARHAKVCRSVVAARKNFAKEDKKLRRMEVDCFEPGEVFEECIGEFYHIYETRPYMDAKIRLVKALAEIGSGFAAEEALKEACECVTLDEQDHEGVREVLPALMLARGKVQEAYDFIYYWAGNHDDDVSENDANSEDEEENEDEDDDEDMDDNKPPRIVPCLRPTKMNPTDPVDFFVRPYLDSIFHRSALTYIKLTTAFGLNGAVKQLSDPASTEAMNAPLRQFLQANNLPIDVAELQALYEKVLQQAKQAYDLAQNKDAHLWPSLLNPVAAVGEVRLYLDAYAKLWHATPYAIDYVAKQLQG